MTLKQLIDSGKRLTIFKVGLESVGSLLAVLISFLLYAHISSDTLWHFSVDQSKFILIASLLSLKVESWYLPSELNPGLIICLGFLFLPSVFLGWIETDIYLLALLFALTSNLHVYSISIGTNYIPFLKSFVMPFALLITVLTDEKFLNVNLLISYSLLVGSTWKMGYWNNFQWLKIKDFKEIWNKKEFILGGVILHYIDVSFYKYLESLGLTKIQYYLERGLRLIWGIIGVRLRTSMLNGAKIPIYALQLLIISGPLLITSYNFISFYISRYILQTATYRGGIRKYTLIVYASAVLALMFIAELLSFEIQYFNVVSVSLLISVLIGLSVRK